MTKVGLYAIGKSTTLESNKSLDHLRKFHGKVLRTSLSHELESKLQQVLDQAHQVAT